MPRSPESIEYLGIIGRSLTHTLSPVMHTAVFRYLGLDYRYGVLDVAPPFVESLILSLRRRGFRGANVTIPYKQTVMPFLTAIDPAARLVGAVNTLVYSGDSITGFNTDVVGIRNSLRIWGDRIRGGTAVVVGAGGGARAAIASCALDYGISCIAIYNRTSDHAEALAASMRRELPSCTLMVVTEARELQEAVHAAALIVNTTPVGMHGPESPLPAEIHFTAGQVVFDILYTPLETTLMLAAQRDGARTIGGLEMLLHQGAESFRLGTDLEYPLDIARTAVLQKLQSRTSGK
ncbi:MAG: shikimate dehydrogenase [Ignavibacteriales bacterium]|nr:shikimate dehydrogenase [Ignavibacteriales bacterium]